MKITKEHIGKKVRFEDYVGTVIAVHPNKDLAWLEDVDGEFRTTATYPWQLYHEPFIVEGREVKVGEKLIAVGSDGFVEVAYILSETREFSARGLVWPWDNIDWSTKRRSCMRRLCFVVMTKAIGQLHNEFTHQKKRPIKILTRSGVGW